MSIFEIIENIPPAGNCGGFFLKVTVEFIINEC